MPTPLTLHLTDYSDDAHWRWALHDARGNFLADHEVRLDTASLEYRGFVELAAYLDFYSPIRPVAQQLDELGAWIGLHVFGDLRARLAQVCRPPATAVTVIVPAPASALLLRPLELARLPDGRSFATAGIRFVYSAEPPPHLPHTGIILTHIETRV